MAPDADLLAVLRDRGLPHRLATVVVQEIAHRIPTWNRRLRRELRDLVLAEAYFVYRTHPADHVTPAERAADAAALHRWAVRPVLGGGNAAAAVDELAGLLTRFSTSPYPAARTAFREIVRDERSGLPESLLRGLLLDTHRSAERDRPPDPPPPPAPPEPRPADQPRHAPPTRGQEADVRAHPAPEPAPHPAPDPSGPSKDGRVVVSVLGAVLVLLLIVIFASILTR